jgi:N,N-dimethylformamidase beta subunit-like protein/concanavalin A-like lectin/glucanase superfamily protein
MKTIMGYSDKISACPGETINFMVSCEGEKSYRARLVQIIHGDTSPGGPGYKEKAIKADFERDYPARKQNIYAGSHAIVPPHTLFDQLKSFTVQAYIWPTTPEKGRQTLLSLWNPTSKGGFILGVDENGGLSLTIGDGAGRAESISTGKQLIAREWYLAAASFDADKKEVRLYQQPLVQYARVDTTAQLTQTVKVAPVTRGAAFLFGATPVGEGNGRVIGGDHFNGKIDRPRLTARALSESNIQRMSGENDLVNSTIAAWDFTREISGERIIDASPNRLHGETINLPVRAMKGHNWTGEEMCWRHRPEHYGAIHFHDDDLYDSGWEVDFQFTVPKGLKSGLYAAHVSSGRDEDFMPFVIRPARGTKTADLVFVVPTASYMAYANEHMMTDAPLAEHLTDQVVVMQPTDVYLHEHREYGASCYDSHSDGSGVCYTSRLRPILTMRPKYQSWLGGKGSSLWQMNADTHIIDWLESNGYAYDCITDEDLHYEGYSAIAPYRVFMTSTHHEYWSKEMWDGLDAFKKAGGRLMYMGANAWYWRVAYHRSRPGVLEVRRGEGGIRAWAAEPGEYYHSFTGEYGGLWRRQGLPPQMMAGTGFSAQGFDVCSYYKRTPESRDPRVRFIFDGVEDEIIGNFGLIGGGAAGLELDRADRSLGTPPNALVLASSEAHSPVYMVVLEEIYINAPGMCGGEHPFVRADMVFYETPAGGAVFSTSSISWSGSLSHNNYKNNVSKITANVLERFLKEKPFT